MKHLVLLASLLLFSCGSPRPAPESTPQLAKQEMSDEDIINSLLDAEVSTDPLSTPVQPAVQDTDTGPEGMIFDE